MTEPLTPDDLLRDPEPKLLPVFVADVRMACALGEDLEAALDRLADPTPFGDDDPDLGLLTFDPNADGIGEEVETLTCGWSDADRALASTRSWRLAYRMLKPLAAKLSEKERKETGLVFGCSASGVAETVVRLQTLPENEALRTLDAGRPARLLADALGLSGPAHTVSTACTSGLKAVVDAARLLRIGRTTRMLAGGIDVANPLTEGGFKALGAKSERRSKPCEADRTGLHLGEGGAFFLLTTEPTFGERSSWAELAGWGETSDAHHISAPHPEGHGAERAMRLALERSETQPSEVDWLHLHGTATQQNDVMEGKAVVRAGLGNVPASSVKRAVGHTLAGAGALGAALAVGLLKRGETALPLAFREGETADPALEPLAFVTENTPRRLCRNVLVNAFAFGGSNVSVLLRRVGSPSEGSDLTEASYPCDAASLLPQTGPMRLIDEVLNVTDTGAAGRTVVSEKNLLLTDEGCFPTAGLIELMAQTIGLFAGERCRREGRPPRVGLLLGTRRMTLKVPEYPVGTEFRTYAEKSFESDDGLWQFECRVEAKRPGDAAYAESGSATLTVFNPPEGYFDGL